MRICRLASIAFSAALISALSTSALAGQESGGPPVSALERAADALVESVIPAEDAPLDNAMACIEAAAAVRSTPVAISLLAHVDERMPIPGDLQRILDRLDAFAKNGAPTEGAAGEVLHELQIVRRKILLLLGKRDELAAIDVFDGYATRMLVVGPFGDEGDDYTGVVFPPEREFPRAGKTMTGRFGPVQPRIVSRRWDRFRVPLRDRRTNRAGCFYALHPTRVEQATRCYLRIWCLGSFEAFLNGSKIATIDRALDDRRPPFFVPVVLPKGANQVVIKTCSNSEIGIGLRYVDERGFPLTVVREAEDVATAADSRPVALTSPAPFPRASGLLERTAATLTGDRRARVVLAAAIAAKSPRESMRLLAPILAAPPTNPRLRLATAHLVRGVRYLPDAHRRSVARGLVESIGTRLPNHFTRFSHALNHLEDEDKREAAVAMLRERIRDGRTGPETYRRLSGLYRTLGFRAERRALDAAWREKFPHDLRAALATIGTHRNGQDYAGAMEAARSVLARWPGEHRALAEVFERAADRGDAMAARSTLEALHPKLRVPSMWQSETPPATIDERPFEFSEESARLERRLGNETEFLDRLERLTTHPDASLSDLRDAARELLAAGRTKPVKRLLEQVLTADPSDHRSRRLRRRLAGLFEFPAFTPFLVDTAPLIAGFRPTEREQASNSTLVLDHMIVEVYADGSSVQRVHTLRRVNDLRGVETFEDAREAANADELLLLRTIGTDGKSYVPNRVDGRFSMPRLAPGSFIETVYRSYRESPLPGPRRITKFSFQSRQEPFLRSELVLILPREHRSTARLRNFPGTPAVRALADGRTAVTYRVDDSKRLPTESSPPALDDIIPVVAVGEDGSLAPLARGYRTGALPACFVTPWIRQQAQRITQGIQGKDDTTKARAIHSFVHAEIEDARGSTNPTSVLIHKKGPRFWLELALLGAADIPFRLGLCAETRLDNRPAAEPFYKGSTPYEIPCARVAPRGGHPFWLFAGSPRHYPVGSIPAERFGAEVMLIEPFEETRLPSGRPRDHMGLAATGTLSIGATGDATLDLEITIRGDVGFGLGSMLRNQVTSRQQRFARSVVGGLTPGFTLAADVEIVDLKKPGPVRLRCRLTKKLALEAAGAQYLLPLPMPPAELLGSFGGRGGRTLPFRVTDENSMFWKIRVDPGPSFEIVETPARSTADAMLLDYSLRYERDGRGAVVTRDFYQRAGRIEAENFAAWRSLLKKLDDAEAVRIRLEKN